MMAPGPHASRQQNLLRHWSFLCLAGGLALLAYCAFIWADAAVYQVVQSRRFVASTHPVSNSDRPGCGAHLVEAGSPIGRVEIPRLGISVVVLEGVDAGTLRRGAGRIPGGAWPGQPGNLGIAAHRDTFFRPLRFIHKNDLIRLITDEDSVVYQVDSIRIVTPAHAEVLESTAAPILTLVTCYPFFHIGSAPNRFVVHAHQISLTPRQTSSACSTSKEVRQVNIN